MKTGTTEVFMRDWDNFSEHDEPDYDLLIKQRKENRQMKVKSVHTVTVEIPLPRFSDVQVEIRGDQKRQLVFTAKSEKSVEVATQALRRFVQSIELRMIDDDADDAGSGHAPG